MAFLQLSGLDVQVSAAWRLAPRKASCGADGSDGVVTLSHIVSVPKKKEGAGRWRGGGRGEEAGVSGRVGRVFMTGDGTAATLHLSSS